MAQQSYAYYHELAEFTLVDGGTSAVGTAAPNVGTPIIEDDGNIDGSTDVDALVEWFGSNYWFRGFTSSGDPIISLAQTGGTGLSYVLSDTNLSGTTITFNATGPYQYCFAEGTRIATPSGTDRVEALSIGDLVITDDGRHVPVKWVGRQTIRPFLGALKQSLVRVTAGALGGGLPERDLVLTGDHALLLEGVLVNAAALVNGTTIQSLRAADLPEAVTVYHVETENHDVILAEGTPAETFIDYLDRAAFDNFGEYLELYGAERIIPEAPIPRISSARLLPPALREQLGVGAAASGDEKAA